MKTQAIEKMESEWFWLKYLDGDLSAKEVKEANAYLPSSATARSVLQGLVITKQLVRKTGRQEAVALSRTDEEALFSAIWRGLLKADDSIDGSLAPFRLTSQRNSGWSPEISRTKLLDK